MIFGSLVFFFEGNFEGESPDLVSEIGSTDLAAGQPPPVSERHPPRAVAPAQRCRGFLRMTLAALGQESGIIGYPIRRECDEVCCEMKVRQESGIIGYPIRRECDEVCCEMKVRHVSAFNCIECRTVLYGAHDGDLFL